MSVKVFQLPKITERLDFAGRQRAEWLDSSEEFTKRDLAWRIAERGQQLENALQANINMQQYLKAAQEHLSIASIALTKLGECISQQ